MTDKKASVGIVGVGMVGAAVSKYYKESDTRPVFEYDKNKKLNSLEEALGADFVFLCLPTPTLTDGTQDTSAFEEIVPKLLPGSKVVIKSTVLPGTTAKYQKARPDVFLIHNPEFLDARTAAEDFAKPDLQVVGTTEVSRSLGQAVMDLLPRAPHSFVCASDESEMVKYFLNTFMATKNSFANQMYDYCRAKGIDYEAVKNIVREAPRMGGEVHLKIWMDGYRGFGGACLPKDIAALTHDAASLKKLPLLELVDALNHEYVKEQKSDNHG